MSICEKHRLTVAKTKCPLCQAEVDKLQDDKCQVCVEKNAPANSMTCASCLINMDRPNFKKSPGSSKKHIQGGNPG